MRQTFAFNTAIFALVVFAFTVLAIAQPAKNLEALKGNIVPDFPLRSIDGKVQKFSQFRGKVVLLNFWSPY
ncbi:MAG: hypothetical protein N2116_07400 [Armatimonadetes bacterium]|nr:hypothetical protein [Armatimonadota bacterium]